jgi:rhodanese-related sulfurtransferase
VPRDGLGSTALSDNPATMETFDVHQFSPEERAMLEISLPSALELAQLRMATLIDIRQGFEIEMKGAIPDAVHIPLFEVKRLLGDKLTEDEQEILDTGKPSDIDIKGLLTTINRLHHAHDHLLLLTCNSGRRSLYAAKLLLRSRARTRAPTARRPASPAARPGPRRRR